MIPNRLQSASGAPSSKKAELFDDALPTALKQTGVQKQTTVHLHKEHSRDAVSPYIIHLGKEDPALLSNEEDSISELEEQIKLQQRLYLETDEPAPQDNDLTIDFQDLANQLRETEHNLREDLTELKELKNSAPNVITHTAPEKPAKVTPLASKTVELNLQPTKAVQYERTEVTKKKVVTEKYTKWNFGSARTRGVAAFAALAIVAVLPMQALIGVANLPGTQNSILAASESGLDHILRGSQSLERRDFELAQNTFSRASVEFAGAQEELASMNLLISGLVSIVPETEKARSSAKNLLVAGEQLSYSAEALTLAAEDISTSSPNLSVKLAILSKHIESALPHMESAASAVKKIHPASLPKERQEEVLQLIETLPSVYASMEEFLVFADTLQIVLGEQQSMRYLLTFQNTAELRATGGFMGSFAEVDLRGGEIERMHVPGGGTYDIQGQLQEWVAAPEPLSLINPRWEMQDANWSPDFSQSAQKLAWFYENAGGPTVDGVIAINSDLLPSVLGITGPLELEERDLTVNAENVLFEIQKSKTEDVTQPKALISDLTPALFDAMSNLEMEGLLQLADLLGTSLTEKSIQLYFKQNALQSQILALGWGGAQTQTLGDYLMLVNSNIGGGKTDTIIDQDVQVDVAIQENGQIINTVTLTKTHNGIASQNLNGLNNVDYLRTYVPKGSVLLNADGFEIPPASLFEQSATPLKQDEDLALSITNQKQDPASKTDIWDENGKTVFGNWMQTAPGETQVITLTYVLPFTIDELANEDTFFESAKNKLGFKETDSYSMVLQSQSGVKRTTRVKVHLPDSLQSLWSSFNESGEEILVNEDQFLTMLLEKIDL